MKTLASTFADDSAFVAGTTWCLHLDVSQSLDDVKLRLTTAASAKQKAIAFAQIPRWRSLFHRHWHRDSPVAWLASNSSLTTADAQSLVDMSPIPIYERFSCNAGDPRGILSTAAAIHGEPHSDVIAYSTAGCSPVGVSAIHRFVSTHAADRCIIHFSLPSFIGTSTTPDWICPDGATCVA